MYEVEYYENPDPEYDDYEYEDGGEGGEGDATTGSGDYGDYYDYEYDVDGDGADYEEEYGYGNQVRGLPLSTSAPRGERGSKNLPILRTNSTANMRTWGEGVPGKFCRHTLWKPHDGIEPQCQKLNLHFFTCSILD